MNKLWGEEEDNNDTIPPIETEFLKSRNVEKLELPYDYICQEEIHDHYSNRYNLPRDTILQSLQGVIMRSPSPTYSRNFEDDDCIVRLSFDQSRSLMRRSISILLLHTGFVSTTENSLSVLTDILEMYLQQFGNRLRLALDQEKQNNLAFPDIFEKVFCELNVPDLKSYLLECLTKKKMIDTLHNSTLTSPEILFKDINHIEDISDTIDI